MGLSTFPVAKSSLLLFRKYFWCLLPVSVQDLESGCIKTSSFGCTWLVFLLCLFTKWIQPLVQDAEWSCSRQQTEGGTQETPRFLENHLHHRAGFTILFHHMGTGIQEVWGICILENAQRSPGQGPEQPTLAGHVLNRVFPNGLQALRVFCPTVLHGKCIPWMCCVLHDEEVSGCDKDSSLRKWRQHKLTISLYRITF